MGKKSKIGKQRRDKYYHLAKETGYRSRAAFKLIQLNRKFEFLQKSRVCIDLCAAPGGWMQVAHENMPVSAVILGVDLFPIKSIPGCISIVGDITTDKCRAEIGRELKTWKADIVLNDGAPNVGKNWLIDAYQQSLLTLSALKLATQYLRRGGWFVTKVFRSKDYTALLWAFKQLFKKVHATKPHASRNESAEIFVVCQHYFAPDKLDPKLLDPKHVFAETDLEPKNKLNVYNPEKQKKAKPLGYPENDYTLYHKLSVKDFIESQDGIDVLQDASEIVIDDENILNHVKTTNEIIECCKDIKVLGKKELRLLLNWWKILKDESNKKKAKENAENDEAEKKVEEPPKTLEELEDLEDEQITKDIENLRKEEQRELKRKRKKANKEKTKLEKKMNLNMVIKGDTGPEVEGDEEMFSLKQFKTEKDLNKLMNQNPDMVAQSDDDSENEIKKPKKVRYEKDTGHLDSKGLYYKDEESELEFSEDDDSSVKSGLDLSECEEESAESKETSGINVSESEEESDDSNINSDSNHSELEEQKKVKNPIPKKVKFKDLEHPLLTDLDDRHPSLKKVNKAEMWFQRDTFKDLISEREEDIEIDKMIEVYQKKGGKIIGLNDKDDSETKGIVKNDAEDDKDDDEDSDYSSDYNVDEVISPEIKCEKVKGKDGFEIAPKEKPLKKKKRNLTVEELAMGAVLTKSKKSRRDLLDGAWNRYAFNDDNLPDWFVEDESKHMKKEIPVPTEEVIEHRKGLENIKIGRPIKKAMEAKARKKKRADRKFEKAKRKVENVMDNTDISDREKAKQVRSLYRNALKPPKKEVTYVVAKKYAAKKRATRPPNVKGRYKVVDPRMKKDMRAQKAKEKTKGRGKSNKGRPRTAGKRKSK